jgi:hypothetical protein
MRHAFWKICKETEKMPPYQEKVSIWSIMD